MIRTRLATFPLLMLAFAASAATEFGVTEIPIRQPGAYAFLVRWTDRNSIYLGILDGAFLSFHSPDPALPVLTLNLPPGTTAIDVADIDNDGRSEIIALEHARILRFDQLGPDSRFEQSTLFEIGRETSGTVPFPSVLAVQWEGETALALPFDDSVQIRRMSGELLAEIPTNPDVPSPMTLASPFNSRPASPAVLGVPGASIEWTITSNQDAVPNLPETLRDNVSQRPPPVRYASPSLLRQSAERIPESWPWFPLQADPASIDRVHFALSPPNFRDTMLSLRRTNRGVSADPNVSFRPTPPRVYPGMVVPPTGTPPDFNRDGYSDVAFWTTPLPGLFVDALARAVQAGSWPLTLSIHLFDASQGLYSARAVARVRTEVPIHWFLEPKSGSPLRNLLFSDLTGDGRPDLAFSPTADSFAIWPYEDGLRAEPIFRQSFRRSITAVEILSTEEAPRIVLRSDVALYLLTPAPSN